MTEITNEIYHFQTTPLTGYAPHRGSRIHAVGAWPSKIKFKEGNELRTSRWIFELNKMAERSGRIRRDFLGTNHISNSFDEGNKRTEK